MRIRVKEGDTILVPIRVLEGEELRPFFPPETEKARYTGIQWIATLAILGIVAAVLIGIAA